jgi:hypothetical protein
VVSRVNTDHDLTTCPCDPCQQWRDDCNLLDEFPVLGGRWWNRRKVKPRPTHDPDPNKPSDTEDPADE